jgi:hypothetical protein
MADEVVAAPTTLTDGSAPVTTAPVTTAPAATPSWRDTLPEDIRSAPELAKYQDIAALAKGHLNQSKLVGAKVEGLVKVPGENATPEEHAAFNKARGVPEAPEGYTLKRPQLAAVLGWNEQAEKNFTAAAHKAGYTPQQAQAAVDFYGSMLQAQHDADRAMEKTAGLALRTEWGANYDANLGIANRALSEYGGNDLIEFLHTSKLGADSRMVKAWAKVGQDLMEHGVISGEGIGGVTYEDAQAKIREIDAELMKVDENSGRAKELTEQKWRYLAVRR